MGRYFEKISFQQFQKDISNDKEVYNQYLLPKRSTNKSAGYDFFAIENITLKPGEIKKIPTGYKANFESDEMLLLVIRSSMGFKYNVRLTNQIGIIDCDYYNNINNEGHILVSLQNEGKKEITIKEGEAYVQGIFTKFLISDNDCTITERIGGVGSTNKRKDD